MLPVGCFVGCLYPDSGRTRWVSYWPPVPQLRPAHSCGVDAQRLLLAAYTSFGLALLSAIFGCSGQLPPYSASCPSPRAASPLGAEAGDPYGSQFSSYLIVRSAGLRARRRPLAEGATHPARDRLRRHRTLVEAANKRGNTSDSPEPGGRRHPLRRPATHRCVPRRLRSRIISPSVDRAPGKSCSKAIHAFERFSPSSAARGAARHPNRAAFTLQAYTRQEETALGPGRPRVPAVSNRQPLPRTNAEGERYDTLPSHAEAPAKSPCTPIHGVQGLFPTPQS